LIATLHSIHYQELLNSFFFEAGVLAEFVDGDEIPWLFVVFAADLGDDLAGSKLLLACDVGGYLWHWLDLMKDF
jgi:hypothetical protein